MESLDVAGVFVTFLALFGPQKVLLSFIYATRDHDARVGRRVAIATSCAAAFVGALCAFTAPWLTGFFHISAASLQLAGGIVFFAYAFGLVFGLHFGSDEHNEDGSGDSFASGFRELLLPYVVSPLAVTADLVEALNQDTWEWRSVVAGVFAAVALINAVCMVVLAPLVRRANPTVLEVLSRLLGLLLVALGVEIFLMGLHGLGLLPGTTGH
jgi:multiple antibiotic resistance protein